MSEQKLIKITRALSFGVAVAFLLGLAACSEQRAADSNTPPSQTAQQQEAPQPANHQEAEENGRKLGEKAREAEIQTREDRAKLKEGAREAGKKIKKGSEEVAAKASAAAEGIREGWNDRTSKANSNAVDINHASATDLIALGLSRSEAQHVIAGRPYKSKQDLADRNIVSAATYRGLADRITAK